ncbi:winged helix-turn-helix transcriptional regulator [Haloechinothrix salitolerans]|uniref:Winged helix-turn-helix transcriptional regulator n=1 Tax=Haloechinothrix salitolerans TaxID=926830 RepID=A0ABW2C9B7_9PSEU
MLMQPSSDEPTVTVLEGLQRQLNHKWAPHVLAALSYHPHRFGELRDAIARMSDGKLVGESVLAKTLQDLQRNGLVKNTQDESTWPIIVSTYALTEHARRRLPELLATARQFLSVPEDHAG